MKFYMQISARQAEGILERLLGVIRFRGFNLLEMTAHTPPVGSGYAVTLKVTGQRNGENLKRQLEKLADVQTVDMFTLAQPAVALHEVPASMPAAVAV